MEFKVSRPMECPFCVDELDCTSWFMQCSILEEGVCIESNKVRLGLPEHCPLRSGSVTVEIGEDDEVA
jgi:hypothetical protein